jgi:hypothetical protein
MDRRSAAKGVTDSVSPRTAPSRSPAHADRAVPRDCCVSDPWRTLPSIRTNLVFGSDNRFGAMGQAKQRHRARRSGLCVCGSGTPAIQCCWTERGWRKVPVKIDLLATGEVGSHQRCYLRQLNTCSSKISGEHTISATVLKAIGKDSVKVSGFPWLNGETRSIGIDSLATNCLCTAHNTALSPLDAEAGRFYRALEDCLQ